MKNTLAIQHYEDQIAVLAAKVKRLEDQDRSTPVPSFYTCTRCGLLYQSPYGCGCPASLEEETPAPEPFDLVAYWRQCSTYADSDDERDTWLRCAEMLEAQQAAAALVARTPGETS